MSQPKMALFVGILLGAVFSSRAATVPGLGTTSFPTTTGSPEAQSLFLRGLLLLHLFEYSEAADSFIAAEKLDPGFAMAYWGEAMTFNHGVWNQLDASAGKAALDKFAPSAEARSARIDDPREKAYMAAVELLYDGKGSKVERDKRYALAMERLSSKYPNDRNAQLFHALALLGQSESIRDVPVYLRAAEISKAMFRLEPDNPGAAHYWIHGMDDPEHAAGALEAARALSKIAPDAPHAQHMCSHIFMALGMWDDVVRANLEAVRVSEARDAEAGFPAYRCGHYPDWLEYGYFQQGRYTVAKQTVGSCLESDTESATWIAAHPGKFPYRSKSAALLHRRLTHALAVMQGMAILDAGDWSGRPDAGVDLSVLTPEGSAWLDFAAGFAAAKNGSLPEARSALKAMRAKTDTYRSGSDADPEELQALGVAEGMVSGLVQVKAGNYEGGVAEVRHASETYRSMAFAFGPPITIKPPEELLGEIQLEKGDGTAARQSFTQALERAPRRTQSLLGLARAEHMAGDQAASQKTYQTLLTIWHAADANTPGLEEARKAVAKLQ